MALGKASRRGVRPPRPALDTRSCDLPMPAGMMPDVSQREADELEGLVRLARDSAARLNERTDESKVADALLRWADDAAHSARRRRGRALRLVEGAE